MNNIRLYRQPSLIQGEDNSFALIHKKTQWTYGTLRNYVLSTKSFIKKILSKNGQQFKAVLFFDNNPSLIVVYHTIIEAGGIVVSFHSKTTKQESAHLLEHSKPEFIFSLYKNDERIATEHFEFIEQIQFDNNDPVFIWKALINSNSPVDKVNDNSDVCEILYTSGTVGTPKGVALTYSNVLHNVQQASRCYSFQPTEKALLFLPLHHCFGQNAVMNTVFYSGATLILSDTTQINDIIDSVVTHDVTHFFAVPTVYQILLHDESVKEKFKKSVRYYFSAAAKLPLPIEQSWYQRFGIPIYQGYGLTETSPFSTYNHWNRYKQGSVGSPIEGVSIHILDEQLNEVAQGKVGQIAIAGPNVMHGYWNEEEETKKVFSPFGFLSGDVGYIDEEGYLFIVDRIKDMINVSGVKVFPNDVELVLLQHPAIAEAAVFGIPHLMFGETVAAHIVLKPNSQETKNDILEFCKERISSYKIPSKIEFVNSIPKGPTGKILKRKLKELETK